MIHQNLFSIDPEHLPKDMILNGETLRYKKCG